MKKKKNKQESLKTHAQKKRSGRESVESVLREEKSLWWEGLAEEIDRNIEGVMDESSESTDEEVAGAGKGESVSV